MKVFALKCPVDFMYIAFRNRVPSPTKCFSKSVKNILNFRFLSWSFLLATKIVFCEELEREREREKEREREREREREGERERERERERGREREREKREREREPCLICSWFIVGAAAWHKRHSYLTAFQRQNQHSQNMQFMTVYLMTHMKILVSK